jgi:hypothetical protein
MFRAATLHKAAVSPNEVKLIFFWMGEASYQNGIIFLSFVVDEKSSFVAPKSLFVFFGTQYPESMII